MVWRRICRTRKDSTLIIKPILSTYDGDYGSVLEQTYQCCIRDFLEFAKNSSCLGDIIFGDADSGIDTVRRLIWERRFIRNPFLSHKSHHLCDIATVTVTEPGTWQKVLFWKIHSYRVIFFRWSVSTLHRRQLQRPNMMSNCLGFWLMWRLGALYSQALRIAGCRYSEGRWRVFGD